MFITLPPPPPAYVVTCDSLTITAPTGVRVLFGMDAEPPGEVTNGNSVTRNWFPSPDGKHSFAIFTFEDNHSVLRDNIHGDIECPIETIEQWLESDISTPEFPVVPVELVQVKSEIVIMLRFGPF